MMRTLVIFSLFFGAVVSQDKVCSATRIALVLDTSGSVSDEDLDMELKYARYLFKLAKIEFPLTVDGSRAGAVKFAKNAEIVEESAMKTHCKADLENALEMSTFTRVSNTGRTNIIAALDKAKDLLIHDSCNTMASLNNPRIIVVITDGMHNSGGDSALLKQKSIDLLTSEPELKPLQIFAIGVAKADISELNLIASSPQNVLKVGSFAELMQADTFNNLLEAKLCPPINTTTTTKAPPTCNCTAYNETTCLSWGKEDIFYNFQGLCFADKLKKAIEHVEKRINLVHQHIKKIDQCLHELEGAILDGGSPHQLKQYKECFLVSSCTNAENLRRLKLKLAQLQRELKREQDKENLGFLGSFMGHIKGEQSGTSGLGKVW